MVDEVGNVTSLVTTMRKKKLYVIMIFNDHFKFYMQPLIDVYHKSCNYLASFSPILACI